MDPHDRTWSVAHAPAGAGRAGPGALHRRVVIRLVLVWIGLSVLIGGVVLSVELEKQDRFVLQLALRESALFGAASMRRLAADPAVRNELAQSAAGLVRQNFVVVELYDASRRLLLEVVRPGSGEVEQGLHRKMHAFPLGGSLHHERRWLDGRLFLLVLVPLRDLAQPEAAGFFEGVYQVDAATLAGIRDDLLATLLTVASALLAATVAMYPIILSLNRDLIGLSSDLLSANVELMDVVGSAIAKRDAGTNAHNFRVTFYAVRLAEKLGLPSPQVRDLIAGAFLHDVGKIGIHDQILLKQGPLTRDEFEIMKTHVRLGAEITARAKWLHGARDVVEFHHERYDGSGYPRGLKGEEIPFNARLFAVVDVFDALTSERPYKGRWGVDRALELLRRESGSHLDPRLVEQFVTLAKEVYQEVMGASSPDMERRLRGMVSHYFFASA